MSRVMRLPRLCWLVAVVLPFCCNALVMSYAGRFASHGANTPVGMDLPNAGDDDVVVGAPEDHLDVASTYTNAVQTPALDASMENNEGKDAGAPIDFVLQRAAARIIAEEASSSSLSEKELDKTAAEQWEAAMGEAHLLSAGKQLAETKDTSEPGLRKRPMRILVTCLQASGCTMFAKLLGQRKKAMVFMDTHIYVHNSRLPRPEDLDEKDAEFIILKTTIQGDDVTDPMDHLQRIKARFRPDRTVVFLRRPGENLDHLLAHRESNDVDTTCEDRVVSTFGYGNRCGSPEGKLRALEMLWQAREDIFDAAVWYDDLVLDKSRWDDVIWTLNAIGVPIDRGDFAMVVNNEEVEKYARERMGKASFEWSTGDVVDGPIQMATVKDRTNPTAQVQALCPTLAQLDEVQSQPVRAPSQLDADARRWFKTRVNEQNELILLFGNSDYAETLLNWFGVGKSSKTVGNNFAVVCLDDMLEALLRAHGEECFPARPRFYRRMDGSTSSLTPLWMLRLRVVQDLLDEDINVVLSDSDALWLQNPMPTLREVAGRTNADVVSSRGRWPQNIRSRWGATACMGFVYFRATIGAKVLISEMLAFAKRSMIFDDQILINTVLYNAGLRFDEHLNFELSTEVDAASTKEGMIPVDGTVTMALLPHNKFMRICDDDKVATVKNATVAHCVSTTSKHTSTGRIKKEQLASHGLWVIPERWAANYPETEFNPWVMDLLKQFEASPEGHLQMNQLGA